jgi:hypothetical protein
MITIIWSYLLFLLILFCLVYKLSFIVDMHVQEKTQYIKGSILSSVLGKHWRSGDISPIDDRVSTLYVTPFFSFKSKYSIKSSFYYDSHIFFFPLLTFMNQEQSY